MTAKPPEWFEIFSSGARQYGQGYSTIFIFLTVAFLDGKRRREIARLVLGFLMAALAVNVLKVLTGRERPGYSLESGRMWHLLTGVFDTGWHSFPSAHATSAFALSAALAVMYRRGRMVFYLAAVFCGLTRIMDLQHWVSDVIAGGALGVWIGSGAFRWRWLGRVADAIAGLFAPRTAAPEGPCAPRRQDNDDSVGPAVVA